MHRKRLGGSGHGGMNKMPNPGQGLLGSAPSLPPHLLNNQGVQGQSSTPGGMPMGNGMVGNNAFYANGNMSNNAQFGNINQGFRNGNSGMGNSNIPFGNNNQVNSKALMGNGSNGFDNSGNRFGGGSGVNNNNNNHMAAMNNKNGNGVAFGNSNGMIGNGGTNGLVNAAMGLGNNLLQRNQSGSVNPGLLNNIQSQVLAANMNLNTLSPNSNSSMSDTGMTPNQLDSQLSLVNSLLKGNLMNGSNNSMASLQNVANGGRAADFGCNMPNVNQALNIANMATNGNMNVLQQLGIQGSLNNQINMAAVHSNGGQQQQQQAAAMVAQQMGNMLNQKHQLAMPFNDCAPDAKRMRLENQGILGSYPVQSAPSSGPLNQGLQSHSGRNASFKKDHGNHHGVSRFSGYNRQSRRNSRDSWDSSHGNRERRNFFDGRNGHNSPVRRDYGRSEQAVDNGQEEYDPAEPTDEVSSLDINLHGSNSWASSSSSDQLQHHLHPHHQHQDGYQMSGYDHNRSPSSSSSQDQKTMTTSKQSHRNVTRDLSITIDNKTMSDHSQDQKKDLSSPEMSKSQYFCHACNVDCLHLKNFENHMESAGHKMRIDEVLHLHMQKTSQMNDRLRAEAHLRSIENDDRRNDFCSICDKTFYGHVINHRRSQEHKQNKKRERAECKFCSMTFRSPKSFVAHCNTETHRKKKALLRKEDDADEAHSQDEDDGVVVDMGDMVTVDATGIFEEEEAPANTNRDDATQKASQESQRCSTETTANEKDNAKPTNISLMEDTDIVTEEEVKKQTVLYNPQEAVGQDFVIPVSGFFCRLCNKFYNDENTARWRHCQSRTHFEKFQAQKKSNNMHTGSIKSEENSLNSLNETKENAVHTPTSLQIVSNNNEKETTGISINFQINGIHSPEVDTVTPDCTNGPAFVTLNNVPPKCPLQCRENVISTNALMVTSHNQSQENSVHH